MESKKYKKSTIICLFLVLILILPLLVQAVTEQEALDAISRAEMDMQEMQEAGFSTIYINDTFEVEVSQNNQIVGLSYF